MQKEKTPDEEVGSLYQERSYEKKTFVICYKYIHIGSTEKRQKIFEKIKKFFYTAV